MIENMMVIVPTRGRPKNMLELINCWKAAKTTADIVFAVDHDDPELEEYRRVFEENQLSNTFFVEGERLRLGGTLNLLANHFCQHYRYVGFMGDDHRPRTMEWDEKIRRELDKLTVGIVYGDDLVWGEGLPTAVFMTSNIVSTLGYMIPPGMIHLYLDNFWLDLGRAISRISYLGDVVIEHMHPCVGKSDSDDGYIEVNSSEMYSHDRELYEQYKQNQMDQDVQKLCALV